MRTSFCVAKQFFCFLESAPLKRKTISHVKGKQKKKGEGLRKKQWRRDKTIFSRFPHFCISLFCFFLFFFFFFFFLEKFSFHIPFFLFIYFVYISPVFPPLFVPPSAFFSFLQQSRTTRKSQSTAPQTESSTKKIIVVPFTFFHFLLS